MRQAFIGVDVGTLSARAGVFDSAGALIASARRPIAIWREPGEIVEQSSDDIWRAATSAVREAVEASGLKPEAVRGMGFDATCSLVALDRDGHPLSVSPTGAPERNVIVWMDHRAAGDAERINAGAHAMLRYVGGRISPEMHAPKLAWLARARPETIASAGHFFDLTDFLSFRATGSLIRSACTAACKFGYLAHEKRWPGEFFDSVGLGFLGSDHYARIGAEMAWPGAPLGRGLTAESAAAMGLRQGTPVGAGLIDAHAGAAGTLGARLSGVDADPRRRLALVLGTSSSCMALSDQPRFVDGVWGPHFGALTPGQWLIDGGQSAFGGAIDHLMRLNPAFAELEARTGAKALAALEKDIVARASSLSQAALIAESLHVLPDFIGARSPTADPGARGAIMGLDLREDSASLRELYVAGLCGLAYGLGDIVRKLELSGYAFDSIVVSGGAARSALIRQIIADACGKIVEAPQTPEPVLLGSAMVGAVAAGAQTMASAMSAMSAIAPGGAAPAGGAIAAFHRQKRRACEMLRRTEREIRQFARKSRWPELVIFDCDGVVVDSEGIALAVTRRRVGEAGLRLTDRGDARALPRAAPRFGRAPGRSRTRGAGAQGVRRRSLARHSQRLRPRSQGRRRRAAGGRGLARARVRRLLERARAAAPRTAGDRLRGLVRAQHFFRRRRGARKAEPRPFPVRGARDGRFAQGLPGDRGQRRGSRRRARRGHDGVRVRRREPLLAGRRRGGFDRGRRRTHLPRHGAAARTRRR